MGQDGHSSIILMKILCSFYLEFSLKIKIKTLWHVILGHLLCLRAT